MKLIVSRSGMKENDLKGKGISIVRTMETITGVINEEWRSIDGFINYQVSNIGRIRNFKGRMLKPKIETSGYYRIGLYNQEGKQIYHYIHRLVAHEFLHNPDDLPCVDHQDHNKANNTILNLRWCTNSQNQCNRRKQVKLTHSKYIGVAWHRPAQKWFARIQLKKRRIHLGYFDDERDAARAYNQAAIERNPEFAELNIIED